MSLIDNSTSTGRHQSFQQSRKRLVRSLTVDSSATKRFRKRNAIGKSSPRLAQLNVLVGRVVNDIEALLALMEEAQ